MLAGSTRNLKLAGSTRNLKLAGSTQNGIGIQRCIMQQQATGPILMGGTTKSSSFFSLTLWKAK
ncbi:hypothetical protein SKAU_G00195790 [Synaphobranchus kaupii]|uniref:Uncharacterized protein n=1 Tax=Synaphobranchus kaupii TaxID=118154 RepID=A0A9Q1IXV0_SYNKA|nr:hypothetical protein SKAU_G00195790 [Synaphobranchus kaupii]